VDAIVATSAGGWQPPLADAVRAAGADVMTV